MRFKPKTSARTKKRLRKEHAKRKIMEWRSEDARSLLAPTPHKRTELRTSGRTFIGSLMNLWLTRH